MGGVVLKLILFPYPLFAPFASLRLCVMKGEKFLEKTPRLCVMKFRITASAYF